MEQQLISGSDIQYKEIRDLFHDKTWDVSYLSETGFSQSAASPIKSTYHLHGYDIISDIHSLVWNGIVVAKYLESTNDYSFYTEAEEILLTKFDKTATRTSERAMNLKEKNVGASKRAQRMRNRIDRRNPGKMLT